MTEQRAATGTREDERARAIHKETAGALVDLGRVPTDDDVVDVLRRIVEACGITERMVLQLASYESVCTDMHCVGCRLRPALMALLRAAGPDERRET